MKTITLYNKQHISKGFYVNQEGYTTICVEFFNFAFPHLKGSPAVHFSVAFKNPKQTGFKKIRLVQGEIKSEYAYIFVSGKKFHKENVWVPSTARNFINVENNLITHLWVKAEKIS